MSVIPKKAILVGINYVGSNCQLNGCWNDVDILLKLLMEKHGYKPEHILLMRDNGVDVNPSSINILKAFNWMLCPTCIASSWNVCNHINDAYLGDNRKLFFSYSGHGCSIADANGDERDGKDEAIYCQDNVCIIDDDLYGKFISKIPLKDELICLFDCCHSGSIVDLRTCYYPLEADKVILEMNSGYNEPKGTIKMLSGCLDNQSSADAYIATVQKYQGALTQGVCNILEADPLINIGRLCNSINKFMKNNNYSQRPVISTSKNVSIHDKYLN
jgi:hypothetical protein